MSLKEVAVAVVICLVIAIITAGLLFQIKGVVETVRVVEVDDGVKCAIVRYNRNVSIDCWVENEHE